MFLVFAQTVVYEECLDNLFFFPSGGNLPSDFEMGSDSNDGSDGNNPDEEDDGDWNMMGAALEREFLGLED